jgi:hypothetical protein
MTEIGGTAYHRPHEPAALRNDRDWQDRVPPPPRAVATGREEFEMERL